MSILSTRFAPKISLPSASIKDLTRQITILRLNRAIQVQVIAYVVLAALITASIYHYFAAKSPSAQGSDSPTLTLALRPGVPPALNPVIPPHITNLLNLGPASPQRVLVRMDPESEPTVVHIDLQAIIEEVAVNGPRNLMNTLREHRLNPNEAASLLSPEILLSLQNAFETYQTNQALAANLRLYRITAHEDAEIRAYFEENRIQQELQEALETFEPPEGTHIADDDGFFLVELDTTKMYQDPDHHLALLKSARRRDLANNIGVAGSKLLGLSCYFTTTLGPIYDAEAFKQAAFAKDDSGDLWRALKPVNERRCLSSGAVDAYSAWLMERHKHLKMSCGSTHPSLSISIPEIEEGKTLYAIPVVLAGVRKHIVTFIYDSKEHILEYYDSKGWGIRDCQDYLIDKSQEKITLLDMYLQVMSAYSTAERGAPRVWENLVEHQSDFYNCGVYVLDRIHKLAVLGKDEEGIGYVHNRESTGPNFHDATSYCRKEILLNLIPELENLEANMPRGQSMLGAAASNVTTPLANLFMPQENGMDALLEAAAMDPHYEELD